MHNPRGRDSVCKRICQGLLFLRGAEVLSGTTHRGDLPNLAVGVITTTGLVLLQISEHINTTPYLGQVISGFRILTGILLLSI